MMKDKALGLSIKGLKTVFNQFGLEIRRKKNIPEISFLGLRQSPIKTIIDIGANQGQFAKHISTVFPVAKLYCFEPLPEPYLELNSWVKSQGGRVEAFNVAIGEENKEVIMMLHNEHSPSSSLLPTTELTNKLYPQTLKQSEIIIQQRTLDEMMYQKDIENQILIKMDVQGYEDRVIAGGGDVFSKAHACITEIALDTLYHGQATFAGLLSDLNHFGYNYAGNISQVYATDCHCIYLDALFIRG